MSTLFNVIVKTDGKNDGADRSYSVHLDEAATLKAARELLEADLALTGRWSFVAAGSELTASAEKVQTLSGLAKSGEKGQIVLLRYLPSKEQTGEERAAARTERDAETDAAETRREKEAAKVRAHADSVMSTLTALQASLVKPGVTIDPETIAVAFRTLDHAARLGHDGTTGQSLRELDAATVEGVVRSLGLPRTTSRAPEDGTFMVNEIVARLRPEAGASDEDSDPIKTVASRYVVAVNEIETRVESYHEEWEKKAAEAGFSHIAASLKAAYRGPAFSGALAVNYGQSSSNAQGSSARQESVYLVGIQEVRKARVHTPPQMIELDPLVEAAFAEASLKGAAALKPLLDLHGYFVITEYTLGGKLYTSERESKSGSSEASTSQFQREFGAAVDAQGMGAAGSASFAMNSGQNNSASNKDQRQSSNFHLSAKGGSVTDRGNPKAWTESLTPANWEVISYGRLVPIYEFLRDREVRERVRNAVQELALANQAALEAGEAARAKAWFEKWAVYSAGVERQSDARGVGPKKVDTNGRYFCDNTIYANTGWVTVPDGKYFKGAGLYIGGDRLQIELIVTDRDRKSDQTIRVESTGRIECAFGEDIYCDTTMQSIPPGKRIIGLRLRLLDNPSNRVGIEVRLADLDGGQVETKCNSGNNVHYIDAGGSRNVRPCSLPSIVPDGNTVAGIRLADLGNDNTMGIEIAVVPLI